MHDSTRTGGRPACARTGSMARLAVLAVLAVPVPGPALAQSGWAAVEGKASAVLPAPSAGPVISASLDCSGQRWTLRLRMADGQPAVSGPISLTVDREQFSAVANPEEGFVAVAMPAAAMERVKSGIRLSVRLSLDGPDIGFSLRGSRRAIEAAAPLCSPRDMSGFEHIELSDAEGPDLELVKSLRDKDIKAFRAATMSEPTLNAGALAGGVQRRIVFGQLCGSSWYFGRTGCNIAGYISGTGEDWQLVFDGEGAALYAIPGTGREGWPDMMSVSTVASGADIIWRWNGSRYEFLREDLAE